VGRPQKLKGCGILISISQECPSRFNRRGLEGVHLLLEGQDEQGGMRGQLLERRFHLHGLHRGLVRLVRTKAAGADDAGLSCVAVGAGVLDKERQGKDEADDDERNGLHVRHYTANGQTCQLPLSCRRTAGRRLPQVVTLR